MPKEQFNAPDGFTLLETVTLSEYDGIGRYLVHDATGCEIFHIQNEDHENLFSFNFTTPPDDDSGVPHIMEHSVLCGSVRFPVKDPFAHLLNISMQTFLNAMTYPDKTIYPAATTNKKDYFNLMQVYGDAVFFPRITKEVFMQEGWHFEADGKNGIKPVGVVYNEMKGAYSSHESLVSEYSIRSLFPDNSYGFDSGGRPDAILGLSYEKFRQFHEKYYHPSNCRIFLYGDIPTDEQLEFISRHFLAGFSKKTSVLGVRPVQRWRNPVFAEYAAPAGEEEKGQTTITVNWLTSGSDDPYDLWTLRVLSEILLGHSGSFLSKAVLDSGLGEDLSSECGLDTDMAESVFTVSIRGTKRGRGKAFFDYVLKALKEYVEKGIPAETIEASLKQMEFHLREKKSGSPMGLRLLNRSLRGWINGRKPWETCVYEENLARLKKGGLEKGYYEKLISKWLIENSHVSIVTVYSDQKQMKIEEKKEKDYLKEKYAQLCKPGMELLSKDLESLRAFQDKEDNPADLTKIPSLGKQDLPEKIRIIPTALGESGAVIHPMFSNQIVYIDLAFDISSLDEQQSFYLPLLASAVTGCGLPGRSWDKVLEDQNLVTGGFTAFADASAIPGGGEKEYFFVRFKALEQDTGKALDLCLRLLTEGDLSDAKRMKQILIEMRNDQKSSILPQGHAYAGTRAAADFSHATLREEFWYGISQLEFLNRLLDNVTKNPELLCRRLEDLRKKVLCSDNCTINVTADPIRIVHWEKSVVNAIGRLPKTENAKIRENFPLLGPTGVAAREWFSVSADVGYSALCVPSFTLLNAKAAHQILLAHILKTGYLWQTVRMKNGAYGAFAAGSSLEGLFSWSSYRDPNPDLSLGSFVDSLDAFCAMELTQEQLLNSLVGVIGSEEKPGSASSDGFLGFRRYLYQISDPMRQTMRDWLFSSRKEDLDAICADLKSAMAKASAILICSAKPAARAAKNDSTWKVKPIKWLH